jgi:alkylation response protein AidB-like acyl-CoA dehydrogenase
MIAHLNEEQQMLREVVEALVAKEVAPYAAEWDRENHCPKELFKQFGELGLIGVFVAECYGGAGLGLTERAIIIETVAKASAGFAIALMANELSIAAINSHGSDAQKEKYLPKMCAGEWVGELSVTEPTGGSDLINHATTLEQTADGSYCLNGRKVFITNSTIADVHVWTAASGLNAKGRKMLTAVVLPPGTAGIASGRKEDKLGLRSSATGDMIAKDVTVTSEDILGTLHKGAGIALGTIGAYGRSGMSAIAVGILKACVDEAVKFSQERILYGKPLANLPAIQAMIAENQIEYEAAAAMLYNGTAQYDMGGDAMPRLAATKYFATEAAIRAARRTMDLMGGYGTVNEYPVGRFLRDALTNIPAGGTSQILKVIIADKLINGQKA